MRQLYKLPVREFKRVVLNVRIGNIDLLKACDFVIYLSFAKKAKAAEIRYIIFESEFRSGQQADSDVGRTVVNYELGTVLPDGCKATRC